MDNPDGEHLPLRSIRETKCIEGRILPSASRKMRRIVGCLLMVLGCAEGMRWRGGNRLSIRGGEGSDALFGEGDGDGEGEQSLNDLLSGMPGMPNLSGAMNGNMEEYEKMMETFMDSPLMQEFLNDPEKMEMSRQALLNNPMALQLMKSMPGLEEILHDKEKWRERMIASKAQFEAMRKAKEEREALNEPPADDFED